MVTHLSIYYCVGYIGPTYSQPSDKCWISWILFNVLIVLCFPESKFETSYFPSLDTLRWWSQKPCWLEHVSVSSKVWCWCIKPMLEIHRTTTNQKKKKDITHMQFRNPSPVIHCTISTWVDTFLHKHTILTYLTQPVLQMNRNGVWPERSWLGHI